MLDEFVHEARVAYFSMEIALQSEIPTYAGGLGVLAGDTLRSAADLNLALVGQRKARNDATSADVMRRIQTAYLRRAGPGYVHFLRRGCRSPE